MAKIYYVKDGSYPQNFMDFGRRVSLDELERRIQGHHLRYLSTLPPEFNPEQPLPSPQHVIVELAMDEPTGQRLTCTGYYLLPQLSPREAEALFFRQQNHIPLSKTWHTRKMHLLTQPELKQQLRVMTSKRDKGSRRWLSSTWYCKRTRGEARLPA